jgi:hypothetical protein
MLTALVRYRLAFLVGVTVIAALLGAVESAASKVVLAVLGLGLAVGALAAFNARHPETFLVRDGAFTTPPSLNAVLMAGVFTVMALSFGFDAAADARRGLGVDTFQIITLVLLALLAPMQWYGVLGPFGTVLRPDGLRYRQLFGSIFVPWEAGVAAEPTGTGINLSFTRPELVVRRGLGSGKAVRTGADRGFAAWAINLYAARPDLRPTIGTGEGLRQLSPARPVGDVPPAAAR